MNLAAKTHCSGCSACKSICPKNAISMIADEDGFLYPQINPDRCVTCHLCEKVCPVLQTKVLPTMSCAYAAYSNDTVLRVASTSGALFSELAKVILHEGGVCFGCVWKEPDFIAIHQKAETLEDLTKMRGSKYVQSDVCDTFREVKEALSVGRKVLYSGTPCQISGLVNFLQEKHENLLLVEVICHGAASPQLFEKYKALLCNGQKEIVDINFREKEKSWQNSSFVASFSDHSEIRGHSYGMSYTRAFLARITLRVGCFHCVAKRGKSGADLTLGDFWGITKIFPDMKDDLGISLLLCHTKKGKEYIGTLLQNITLKPVPLRLALRCNLNFLCPPLIARKRSEFMANYKKVKTLEEFDNLVEKCRKISFIDYVYERIISKIKYLILS